MGFDVARFEKYQISQEERDRNLALLKLVAESVEASRRLDALAEKMKPRAPRQGSKSWQFLQLLAANRDMPAARINALLPEPFTDEAEARRLAREWRDWV